MPRRRLAVLLSAILAAAPAALADEETKLSQVLLTLFSPSNPLILASTGHQAHFESQPEAQALLRQINQGMATQLSTLPIGSSSAGFTYSFDPALGVFNRSAETFGPLFAERGVTVGKGKSSLGFTYLRSTFDRFEGQSLRDGEVQVTLLHDDITGDGTHTDLWYEGDIIHANYDIDLESETLSFFATYGVSDRLDVGIAIPFLRLEMDTRIDTRIEPLATANDPSASHLFQNGTLGERFFEDGEAQGLGDISVRGKYRLLSGETGDLAVGVDLRLPTGEEQDLLGSGATQTKIFVVASGPAGRFSPHGNLGYTFSGGSSESLGSIPDEINYTVGFDAALGRRVTVSADIVGRTIKDSTRLVQDDQEFDFRDGNGGPLDSVFRTEFHSREGSVNMLVGSAGIKVNPFKNFLFSAGALFAIGERGLQDELTPVFGVDYTF